MESQFYTLHDFLVHVKGGAYFLMGAIVLGLLGFWLFITGRDDDTMIQ